MKIVTTRIDSFRNNITNAIKNTSKYIPSRWEVVLLNKQQQQSLDAPRLSLSLSVPSSYTANIRQLFAHNIRPQF